MLVSGQSVQSLFLVLLLSMIVHGILFMYIFAHENVIPSVLVLFMRLAFYTDISLIWMSSVVLGCVLHSAGYHMCLTFIIFLIYFKC